MKRAKKKSENKVEYGTISLPLPLIDKIRKRIKGTGIPSVSSYIAFVLRQVLSYTGGTLMEKKDEQEIKNRLKSLGY